MFPRPCRGGARGGVSDVGKKIRLDGKDTVPTPSPPLQGQGVVSKWDGVLNGAVRDVPLAPWGGARGEALGLRVGSVM